MAHGQITHIEFPADDVARARRFYEGLFGWTFREFEGVPDYLLFNTGSAEAGGAIGKRGESTGQQILAYVEVDSIDELLPRVDGLSGKVTRGRSEIPGQGWYAIIVDSEGNELGLYESLPR
jgi:uncharacterized protein